VPTPLPYHLYLHFPWCRSRCPYCAFTSRPSREPPTKAWVQAVLARWAWFAPFYAQHRCRSVYFGGGSPCLLEAADVASILACVPREPDAEVSIELNPGPVTRERLGGWRDAGVTRVSVGVQSFDQARARLLGRARGAAEAGPTLEAASKAGFRSVSADLVFGLPGQEAADLIRDIDRALSLGVQHLSLYGLSIEPETPFSRAVARGLFEPAGEESWRDCFDAAEDHLEKAGFEHYELSNFARPGHRCRHNEGVWQGEAYAGIGPSAHGLLPSGERTQETSDVEAWLASLPEPSVQLPEARQAAIDLLLAAIRHIDGVATADLEKTGFELDLSALAPLVAGGLIACDPKRLRLEKAGRPLADGITLRLVRALRKR
jgi:oxygen-independent coproporphyrinogen III oxidase